MAKGNVNSKLGRPYIVLMLLLAFGFVLIGDMLLHKLRERRIFNLLLKDKHQQLLFQKEKEYTKELKTKTQHMKAKLFSLRNEKMELDRCLQEKQSTIDSLKDEQKIMESTIEEQQHEIKMLRAKSVDLREQIPQVVDLTKMLKQKGAEIEDLKHRLEHSVKFWSVSTNDPSNPPVNLTTSTESEENKTFDESTNYRDTDNTTQGEERNGDVVTKFKDNDTATESGDKMNVTGKVESEKLESSREGTEQNFNNGQGKINEYSQQDGLQITGRDIVIGNETKEDGVLTMNNEKKHNDIQQVQQGDFRGSRGGMKMEITDNLEVNHAFLIRSKGNRWRTLDKNGMLEQKKKFENHEAVKMHSRRLSINDLPIKGTKEMVPRDGNVKEKSLTSQEPVEAGNLKTEVGVTIADHQAKRQVPTNSFKGQLNKTRSKRKKSTVDETMQGKTNNGDEVRQPEDQENKDSHEKLNNNVASGLEKTDRPVKQLHTDEFEKGR